MHSEGMYYFLFCQQIYFFVIGSSRMSGLTSNRNVGFIYIRSPEKRKDFWHRTNHSNEQKRYGTIENDTSD